MADGVGAPVGETMRSTLTGTITSTAIPPSPIEPRVTIGGTTRRIVGALRTQTARQPTGLAQTPAAIRWPAGKRALSNKSPAKKAIWEVRALAVAVDLPIAQVAAILGARVPARERVLARVRAPVAPTASATAVRAAVFQEVTVVDSGQAVSVAALLARAGAGALRASAGGVAEVAVVVVVVVVVAAEAEGGKL